MKKSRLLLLLLGAGMVANSIAAPPQEPLTVTVTGDGIVTSDPDGITCPSECSETYKKGTTVILTATANPNSSFLGWNGACVGTDPICVTKVTAPTVVTAIFETSAVVPVAPVLQTGQTTCWGTGFPDIPCTGTGQDGEYQAGIAPPSPRFIDNGDGTVSDIATGLTWLQQPRCLTQLTWTEAVDAANTMADGQCNLSDGSQPGDWRLPNANELKSLTSFMDNPTLGSSITQPPFVYTLGEICGSGNTIHWSSTSISNGSSAVVFSGQQYITFGSKASSLACAFTVKGSL